MAAIITQSQNAWSPDVTALHAPDVIPEALLLQCSTLLGVVEGDAPSCRVGYVDDAEAEFFAEAAEITPENPTLSEAVVHTGKVSILTRVSREQYLQSGTPAALAQSLSRSVIRRADLAFIAEPTPVAPAVAPMAGLFNHAEIQDGGEVAGNLDGLVQLLADIAAEGGIPTHILLAPNAWAELQKLKSGSGSNLPILPAANDSTEQRVLGVPVIVTSALTGTSGLVIDRNAVVSVAGPIHVATSEHAYFAHDSWAARVTWRFGQSIVPPERCGKFSLEVPTP